ncbi:SagB/ThcOx family dehydrogenase [Apibacter adventoris]|uniref:Dehydrogenase n=1 Tax=Apibacter adventoris TaxID=1679466 RepID=A0A2S8ADX4_9FLAO|nr:SagB/ThcOx family dehydrogenase [Apibacter adventoris]PQL93162.1 dehydrogenase [Apibacter adventoris]
MKRILAWGIILLSIQVFSQDLKTIKLKDPDIKRGLPVMEALSKRKSSTDFLDKELEIQDLSDLLWAANGVNRTDGKRTAPSSLNTQDVDIYICFKEGIYLYNAQNKELEPIAKGDYRHLIHGETGPCILILVADKSKYPPSFKKEDILEWNKIDVGIVSQNISVFCAGTGLATRPRAGMDRVELHKILKLKASQHILLNHPVGYPR